MKYVIFSDLDDTLFCSLNKHKQKQTQTQNQDKNQNINENLILIGLSVFDCVSSKLF